MGISDIIILDDDETAIYITKYVIGSFEGFQGKSLTYTSGTILLNDLKVTDDMSHAVSKLLFLEIDMLKMTGFEFLKQFLLLPEPIIKSIHIYLLTTTTKSRFVDVLLEKGMIQGFYLKPFKKSDLAEVLSKYQTN